MELFRDEVTEYIDARYLSASEASWRLFEFPVHARSHAVERLPVHLERKQKVFSRKDGKVLQFSEPHVATQN